MLCAVLTIAVALTQLGAIAAHLMGGGDDWLSVGPNIGLSVLALVMGVTLWRGQVQGKSLLLAPVLWRHWFVVCFLTLIVAMSAFILALGAPWWEWLRQSPMAILAIGSRFLFTPMQDWEIPIGLDSAQRRTWRRSITFLVSAGSVSVFAAVLVVALGFGVWASVPLAVSVVLFLFAALIRRQFRILQEIVEATRT